MSLDQHDTIDLIVTPDDKEKRVTMVITDAGTITDPDARLEALSEKLKYYFNIVLGEDFRNKYHTKKLSDVVIEVRCVSAPTEKMLKITDIIYPGKNDGEYKMQVRFLRADGLPWILDFPKTYNKATNS